MKRATVALILAAVMLALCFPVFATHGFGSGRHSISVNGNIFDVWGYSSDAPPSFRLRDIAYILNGTSAQFDIRELADDRWDFWIVRGVSYTPDGTELQPIPDRHVVFGSYGFVSGEGFDEDYQQTVMVGLDVNDSGDYPALTVALSVIVDVDDAHFDLFDMADILGFSIEMWHSPDVDMEIETDPSRVADIPLMSVEKVTLLSRMGGHWVDAAHFYSEVIDESVVWPVEFLIGVTGFGEFNWRPIAPLWQPHENNEWFAVHMQTLDSGLVEITVDPATQVWGWRTWGQAERPRIPTVRDVAHLSNVRIVVDLNQPTIDELTYYIGDVAHTMVRDDWRIRHAQRYTADASECGGIRLRYVSDNGSFLDSYIVNVHRATSRDELGEIILTHRNVAANDRILFEFIDTTAQPGQIYYYSLVAETPDGRSHTVWSASQMRVDVDEILGAPEDIPTETPPTQAPIEPPYETESYETTIETEPEQANSRTWIWLLIIALGLLALFTSAMTLFLRKKRR